MIAEHVYTGIKGDTVGEWKPVTVKDPGSLRIGIYERERVDGTKEYVFANAGTDLASLSDWINNVQQPVGMSEGMLNSMNFADTFVSDHPDAHITFVGHSKGGAEAVGNALRTKRNAIVFNPATFNPYVYGLNTETYVGEMTAYIVKGDALNNMFAVKEGIIEWRRNEMIKEQWRNMDW